MTSGAGSRGTPGQNSGGLVVLACTSGDHRKYRPGPPDDRLGWMCSSDWRAPAC